MRELVQKMDARRTTGGGMSRHPLLGVVSPLGFGLQSEREHSLGILVLLSVVGELTDAPQAGHWRTRSISQRVARDGARSDGGLTSPTDEVLLPLGQVVPPLTGISSLP